MIAQLSNSSEVHRLYANKTTDPQTPASIEVEGGGLYQVTIFPIRKGRGILNSDAEYSANMMVKDAGILTK